MHKFKLNIPITISLVCNCFFLLAQPTWQNVGPGGGSDLHVLKFDPTDDNIIYAGGDIEGIFKTTDGGKTWKNINNNLAHLPYGAGIYWICDIVIDPLNSQKIYLCNGTGLWRSTNGGNYWDSLYIRFTDGAPAMVSTLAINSQNTDILFMGLGDRIEGSMGDFNPIPVYTSQTGVYKSIDGGTNWTQLIIPGFDSSSVYSIHLVNGNSDTVIISTPKGIFRSFNGGNSWVASNSGLPHTNCYMLKGVDISGTYTLFLTMRTLGTPGNATSFKGGMFRSTNYGNSWIDITGDLPRYQPDDSLFVDYWRFDINPSNPDQILIGTTRGSHWDLCGIYRTQNATEQNPAWELIYYPAPGGWLDSAFFFDPYVFDVVFAPNNPAKVAFCEIYVSISNDTGVTWQSVFTQESGANKWAGNGLELMNTDAIAFHPSDPNTFYIGYDDLGLFRTDDGGASFQRLDPKQNPEYPPLPPFDGVKDIIIDPLNPSHIYISRWGGSMGDYTSNYPSGGILFSNENGNNFSPIVSGLPEGRCDFILDKVTGSAGNRTLYCAVYKSGIYKSTNSGQTWSAINTGLGNKAESVWKISIHPGNSQILYAGLNTRGSGIKGLYKSDDGGQNWQLLNNIPPGDVLSIAMDSSGKIYVSITDNYDDNNAGGLYLSSNAGITWNKIYNHSRVTDIQIHPSNSNTIVITCGQWYKYDDLNPQGIQVSFDGGSTWKDVSGGINHGFYNFARFNPNKPEQLFAGTAGGGLWMADSIKLLTSMSEKHFSNSGNIIFYPNPAFGNNDLNFYSEYKNSDITIFDISGKQLHTQKTSHGSNKLKVKLSDGIYFYRISGGGKLLHGKLLLCK